MVKEVVENLGYSLLSTSYEPKQSIFIQDKLGYIYYVQFFNLCNGSIPQKFHVRNPYALYNFNLWLKLNNVDIKPVNCTAETFSATKKITFVNYRENMKNKKKEVKYA